MKALNIEILLVTCYYQIFQRIKKTEKKVKIDVQAYTFSLLNRY